MSIWKALTATAVLLGISTGAGFADDISEPPYVDSHYTGLSIDDIFTRFDRDSDGRITELETETMVRQMFSEADRNDDDLLSVSEALAIADPVPVDRLFREKDTDNDGYISMQEIGTGQVGRLMLRADTDHDGVVTREEMDEFKMQVR